MSLPKFLYNNVWRKSNVAYLTYVAVGVIVLGGAYEKITEAFWRSHNRGKLYDQVNWAKFKSADDE